MTSLFSALRDEPKAAWLLLMERRVKSSCKISEHKVTAKRSQQRMDKEKRRGPIWPFV